MLRSKFAFYRAAHIQGTQVIASFDDCADHRDQISPLVRPYCQRSMFVRR
jgi:hypothetical protein